MTVFPVAKKEKNAWHVVPLTCDCNQGTEQLDQGQHERDAKVTRKREEECVTIRLHRMLGGRETKVNKVLHKNSNTFCSIIIILYNKRFQQRDKLQSVNWKKHRHINDIWDNTVCLQLHKVPRVHTHFICGYIHLWAECHCCAQPTHTEQACQYVDKTDGVRIQHLSTRYHVFSEWHHTGLEQSSWAQYSAFISNVYVHTSTKHVYFMYRVPFQSWSRYGVSWLSPARFLWRRLHTVPGRWGEHLYNKRAHRHIFRTWKLRKE